MDVDLAYNHSNDQLTDPAIGKRVEGRLAQRYLLR